MQIPLILSSTAVEDGQQFGLDANLPGPRCDYVEIARLLGAKVIGPDISDAILYRSFRKIESSIRLNLVESLIASRHLDEYSQLLSTSERVAIPMAALMGAKRDQTPHVVIGHHLSSRYKSSLFRTWPLHKSFSHIICVCTAQAEYAVKTMGIDANKVDFVYDKVDRRFFQPQSTKQDDYVLSVGQEQRDYDTLLDALSTTNIKLVIVASSRWSDQNMDIRLNGMENVTVLRNLSYQVLKELYASARIVAVPLFDVSYAAGVNTVLEAMAMAKPVVVTKTAGIADYIENDATGLYVSPGEPEQLRDTLLGLWERSGEQKRLGENARQVVEEQINLENYVQTIAKIMAKVSANGSA